MKEQENSPEELDEMEASNLSDKVQSNDYKETQQHEKRHRSDEKEQSEIKNAIFEINNTLEAKNHRLDEAED